MAAEESAGINFRRPENVPGASTLNPPLLPPPNNLVGGPPMQTGPFQSTPYRSQPPLPPRPPQLMGGGHITTPGSMYANRFNMYGGGPFSTGGYGGYGSLYGGTGYGGAGYGGYGYSQMGGGMANDPVVQMAEENYRNAFSSVESIVHALSSVGLMLESTVSAVHTSFQAVLAVAQHFGQLNTQFGQVLSTLSLFRSLQWLFRKAFYLLGLRKSDPSMEESVWASVSPGNVPLSESDLKRNRSAWHSVVMLLMVFGGPYALWRLLKSMAQAGTQTKKDHSKWVKGEEEHYVAVADYDFHSNNNNEMSFRTGQQLRLAPKDKQPQASGWVLASDGQRMGYIPSNYIKILSRSPGKPAANIVPNTNDNKQENHTNDSQVNV